MNEGYYWFEITSAESVEFKTGSKGLKLMLSCENKETEKPITVYDNLVYMEAVRWKFDGLRAAIGKKEGALTPADLIGERGECCLKRDGKYLSVKFYCDPERNKKMGVDF